MICDLSPQPRRFSREMEKWTAGPGWPEPCCGLWFEWDEAGPAQEVEIGRLSGGQELITPNPRLASSVRTRCE